MRALISGAAASAVIYTTRGIFALLVERKDRWIRIGEGEVAMIFHGMADVEDFQASTRQTVVKKLQAAKLKHDTLQLLLLTLVSTTPEDNRLDLARWLETTLEDKRVAQFVKNRLQIAPFPPEAAVRRALLAARQAGGQRGKLARLIAQLKRKQVAISFVHAAWERETRVLRPIAKRRLLREVSGMGGFRIAVDAILSGKTNRVEECINKILELSERQELGAQEARDTLVRWARLLDCFRYPDFLAEWFTLALDRFFTLERASLRSFVRSLSELGFRQSPSRESAAYKALLQLQLRAFSQPPTPYMLLKCASSTALSPVLIENGLRNLWTIRTDTLRQTGRSWQLPWSSITRPRFGRDWEQTTLRTYDANRNAHPLGSNIMREGLSVEGKQFIWLQNEAQRSGLKLLERINGDFAMESPFESMYRSARVRTSV